MTALAMARSARAWVRTAAVLLALVAASIGSSGPAAAQDADDPYGSTTTTAAGERTATLELTVESGPRGTEVGVFACGYADDAPDGSITFDGEVVLGDLVVDADGCLTTEAGAGSSAGGSGAPATIRVPDDARPGSRNVCGVAAGYTTACARFQVRQDAEVAGARTERDPSLPGVGSLPFGESLPRTGIAAALLVGLALALLVGGRRLLAESRRRRGDAY